MHIEDLIEGIQANQDFNDLSSREVDLLDMAEAALVDLINLRSEGPDSNNVNREVKLNWSK